MRIATITLHNANNFGAVLQAYALQRHITSLDFDTELINYYPNQPASVSPKILRYTPKRAIIYIKNRINHSKQMSERFNSFRNNYLSISPIYYFGDEKIYESPPFFDAYVVGSDQIWNTEITNNSKAFFLHFVNSGLKIAYAASFGTDEIGEQEKHNIRQYLKSFNAVSVREKSMVDILKKEFDIDAQVVLDPVFLLEKVEWGKIIQKTKIPEKYIFVYMMEPSNALNQIAYCLKKETGYRIVFVSASSKKSNLKGINLKGLGPREFLFVISNAEYIVTNSFHGLALSIIFEKKFFAVKHSRRNSRLLNLLELVNCVDKMTDEKSVIDLKHLCINGQEAKQRLCSSIERSRDFIINSLKA